MKDTARQLPHAPCFAATFDPSRAPRGRASGHSALRWQRILCLPLAVSALLIGCEDGPTGTRMPLSGSPSRALTADAGGSAGVAAVAPAADSNPGVLGTLPLPVNQTYNGTGVALRINQTGTGPSANFVITSAASTANALQGNSNGLGAAVRGLMTGSGRAGLFEITNAGSTSNALHVVNQGLGRAIYGETSGRGGPAAEFFMSNSASLDPALLANTSGAGNSVVATSSGNGSTMLGVNFGTGPAGQFDIRNNTNPSPALVVNTDGSGAALSASSTGSAQVGIFQLMSPGATASALEAHHYGSGNAFAAANHGTGPAGYFYSTGNQPAVRFQNDNSGETAYFYSSNPASSGRTVVIQNNGSGTALEVNNANGPWAARFVSSAVGRGGVYIATAGGQGLQVVGGSKNAVVGTSDGARALYTEESTEVWFTDYGFGRLTNGRASIALDTKFSETVSADAPYHVFVQAYGDAELYVAQRTATGFDVVRRGGDKQVEFSYRVVARRKGFEARRLERAPWADDDPALTSTRR